MNDLKNFTFLDFSLLICKDESMPCLVCVSWRLPGGVRKNKWPTSDLYMGDHEHIPFTLNTSSWVVGMYHGGRVMAAGSWNRTPSKNTFNYKQKSRRTESGESMMSEDPLGIMSFLSKAIPPSQTVFKCPAKHHSGGGIRISRSSFLFLEKVQQYIPVSILEKCRDSQVLGIVGTLFCPWVTEGQCPCGCFIPMLAANGAVRVPLSNFVQTTIPAKILLILSPPTC